MAGFAKTDLTDFLARKGYWPAVAGKYLAEGECARAVDLCLRMLETDPRNVAGRTILARSLYLTGQIESARDHFMQILRWDAVNLTALKHLGDILYREGKQATAQAYYRRVLEIDPCCEELAIPPASADTPAVRQLTIRRRSESPPDERPSPLREPAFITETIGDIYREQGYLQLAREVYRRLLDSRNDSRITDKLRETEEKLSKKENSNETAHR